MKDKRQRQTNMCNGFLVDQITLQSLALMMHTVNSMNQQILSVQGMVATNPSQAVQALTSLQQMTIPPNLVSWLRTHLSMHQSSGNEGVLSGNGGLGGGVGMSAAAGMSGAGMGGAGMSGAVLNNVGLNNAVKSPANTGNVNPNSSTGSISCKIPDMNKQKMEHATQCFEKSSAKILKI